MSDENEESGTERAPIPYERFREKVAEVRALKAQLAEFESAKAQLSELPKLQSELARRDSQLGLARAGIVDDDGAEVAMLLWGKLPEQDRPPIGDWIASLRDKPDTMPKALAGYLAPPAAPVPEAPKRQPSPPGNASAATAGAPLVTKQQYDAAVKKATTSRSQADVDEARRLGALYMRQQS